MNGPYFALSPQAAKCLPDVARCLTNYDYYMLPAPRPEGLQLLMGGGPALQAECGSTQIIAEDGKAYPSPIVEWGPPQGFPGAPTLGTSSVGIACLCMSVCSRSHVSPSRITPHYSCNTRSTLSVLRCPPSLLRCSFSTRLPSPTLASPSV